MPRGHRLAVSTLCPYTAVTTRAFGSCPWGNSSFFLPAQVDVAKGSWVHVGSFGNLGDSLDVEGWSNSTQQEIAPLNP